MRLQRLLTGPCWASRLVRWSSGGTQRKFEMGKLPPALLAQSVLSHLGAASDSVVVGPALGEDSAVLRVDHANRLISATTDPITGASASIGHLVVHVNANDVAASGADPKWLLLTQVRRTCCVWMVSVVVLTCVAVVPSRHERAIHREYRETGKRMRQSHQSCSC